jgi:uncharacterized protein YxjI
MKLYLKQHLFSFGDRFSIYDEAGYDRYFVQGEPISFGKKLHLCEPDGTECIFIRQKAFAFQPTYYLLENDRIITEVRKKFTFFKPSYVVSATGWTVEGDFFDHDYRILDGNRIVATVSKEWFTLGDAYALQVASEDDLLLALATTLVIDACLEDERN